MERQRWAGSKDLQKSMFVVLDVNTLTGFV